MMNGQYPVDMPHHSRREVSLHGIDTTQPTSQSYRPDSIEGAVSDARNKAISDYNIPRPSLEYCAIPVRRGLSWHHLLQTITL